MQIGLAYEGILRSAKLPQLKESDFLVPSFHPQILRKSLKMS